MTNISKLSDTQLIEDFVSARQQESNALSLVILHLAAIDQRKLYLKEGYSSLFTYCTVKHHYSEGSAYRRIQAARLSQIFPEVIGLLKESKITLATLSLIYAHLTPENKDQLFKQVVHQSKSGVERILACIFPTQQEVKDKIRRVPQKTSQQKPLAHENSGALTPSTQDWFSEKTLCFEHTPNVSPSPIIVQPRPVARIKPITPTRVNIAFSASQEVAKKIQRAKEILRHKYPEGKLEDIMDEALESLLEKKDPLRKLKRRELSHLRSTKSEKPKVTTRYIPQAIKTAVWKRDGGQCTYVSPHGQRCAERGSLELDHVFPYSLGGKNTVVNLRLLCRSHNQWRARQNFAAATVKVRCSYKEPHSLPSLPLWR